MNHSVRAHSFYKSRAVTGAAEDRCFSAWSTCRPCRRATVGRSCAPGVAPGGRERLGYNAAAHRRMRLPV